MSKKGLLTIDPINDNLEDLISPRGANGSNAWTEVSASFNMVNEVRFNSALTGDKMMTSQGDDMRNYTI